MGTSSQCEQKKRYKDTKKVSMKDFNIPPESWEHRIGQRGVAASEREQMTTKQRGSARLNESAKSEMPELRDGHQSHHFQN